MAVLAALAGMFWYAGSATSPRSAKSATTEAYFSSAMADSLRIGDFDGFLHEVDRLADVDQLDADRTTPLMLVASTGNTRAAEYLLARGANPNVSHAGYGTPLMRAIFLGHVEMVKMLLRFGADANQRSLTYDTPIATATRIERHDIAALLQQHLRQTGTSPLAVANGDFPA